MSELNISLLLAGDKKKGEYTSSEQVGKYKVEACINGPEFPGKINQVVMDCTGVQ